MDKQEIRARVFSGRKTGKKLCSWDTGDIAAQEVKYLMEEFPDEYADEDAAWQAAWEMDMQHEWEYLVEYVTELMKERGLDEDPIYCEVANFGWRGLHGQQVFWADDGASFLRQILPDTDNTFHIYEYGDGLAINNFHHDSPVGREWYYATPLLHAECPKCGVMFVGDYDPESDEEERARIEKYEVCSDCLTYLKEIEEAEDE